MDSASGKEADPAYWQECYEADRQELSRSERVQNQMQTVLTQLQQRCKELEAENGNMFAAVKPDATTEHLESEVEAALQAHQALVARKSALTQEIDRHQTECEARSAEAAEQRKMLAECAAAREAQDEAIKAAEAQREQATLKARSMVMKEALQRTHEEAMQLQSQLEAQQADTSELREALADSWAARAESDLMPETPAPVDPSAAMQALEDMQEELKWLAKMQQEAAAEVHHVQKLERTEAALQAQLRTAMDENAELRNARMDLGDAGNAMREAIASQTERYVGRVDNLAEERKRTDHDREKLMQECAELQVKLDILAPELKDLEGLEKRHSELEAERLSVTTESERLHAVNACLGVLLLGEDAPPSMGGDDGAAVVEGITQLLKLQRRLTDREMSHAEEKQRLVDRIRSLERDSASSLCLDEATAPEVPAQKDAEATGRKSSKTSVSSVPKPLANATSVLQGGFKSFRKAAGV